MSNNLRPVEERWGEPTGMFFGDSNDAVRAIEELCEKAGVTYGRYDSNEETHLWIDGGQALLDYILKASVSDMFDGDGEIDAEDEEAAESLLGNLQGLVPAWNEFISDEGMLTISFDG